MKNFLNNYNNAISIKYFSIFLIGLTLFKNMPNLFIVGFVLSMLVRDYIDLDKFDKTTTKYKFTLITEIIYIILFVLAFIYVIIPDILK